MKLRTVIEKPSITIDLNNGMHVTIHESGDGSVSVRVRQRSRDLLNGAPAPDDCPRCDMGGEYEFGLPDASVIAGSCDQADADPDSADFPREGYATITVTHLHN